MTDEAKGFAELRRRARRFWLACLAFLSGAVLLGLLSGRISDAAIQVLVPLVIIPMGIYAFIAQLRFNAQRCPVCGHNPRNTGILRNSFALTCMHCGTKLYGSHQ